MKNLDLSAANNILIKPESPETYGRTYECRDTTAQPDTVYSDTDMTDAVNDIGIGSDSLKSNTVLPQYKPPVFQPPTADDYIADNICEYGDMNANSESSEKGKYTLFEEQAKTASPVTYISLFWLFIFGSVAGFLLEGVWNVIRKGVWEDHVATIWGPFCIIYGIGAIALYIISFSIKKKKIWFQFITYAAAGSLIEYFSSLFQESCFSSTSWNYHGHFLNIDGRISLSMSVMWGILGVVFVKIIFPPLLKLLESMQSAGWKTACIMLSIFMAVNLLTTVAVLTRWKHRLSGEPASNKIELLIDDIYGNEAMSKRFPNWRFQSGK